MLLGDTELGRSPGDGPEARRQNSEEPRDAHDAMVIKLQFINTKSDQRKLDV